MLQEKLTNRSIGALDTEGAAAYLSVSISLLKKWRGLGMGPRYKKISDRKILYPVKELDRWLEGEGN